MKTFTPVEPKPAEAFGNFFSLSENPYPGRGLIIGLSQEGDYFILVSWIMGRSPNSRNRVYKQSEDGRVYTDFADPSQGGDPSLVIYNAMSEGEDAYVVSNGHQTDTVLKSMVESVKLGSFGEGLEQWEFEPDKPNYTPRITGALTVGKGARIQFSVLSRTGEGSCQRDEYSSPETYRGFGMCLTTYTGDGDPLPSFKGPPFTVPLGGDQVELTDRYWAALNPENRVGLAVKFVNVETGQSRVEIRNQYQQA